MYALVRKLAEFPDKEASFKFLMRHRHLNYWREQLARDFLKWWALEDLEAAYEAKNAIRLPVDGKYIAEGFRIALTADPERALAFLDRHPETRTPELIWKTLMAFGNSDLTAAENWIRTLESEELRTVADVDWQK